MKRDIEEYTYILTMSLIAFFVVCILIIILQVIIGYLTVISI